jgi:hypothetical protein
MRHPIGLSLVLVLLFPGPVLAGASREFDGSADYVDVGTMDVSGSAITICMWAKFDGGIPQDGRLISKATGTAEADHFWMLSGYDSSGVDTDTIRFRLKTNGTVTPLNGDDDLITLGKWHHCAAVYDGSNMTLYVDASQAGQTAKTGTLDTDDTVHVDVGRNPVNGRYFDGWLADVRIYDRALTAAELDIARWSPNLPADGLVLHLPLWEAGTDPTFKDLSGNGRDGDNQGSTESFDGPPIFWAGESP